LRFLRAGVVAKQIVIDLSPAGAVGEMRFRDKITTISRLVGPARAVDSQIHY